jgi:hypothetical protein
MKQEICLGKIACLQQVWDKFSTICFNQLGLKLRPVVARHEGAIQIMSIWATWNHSRFTKSDVNSIVNFVNGIKVTLQAYNLVIHTPDSYADMGVVRKIS